MLFKLTNTGTDSFDVCDQIVGNDVFFLDSSVNWQNNGYGRCIASYTEESGGNDLMAATLTGNDLQIYVAAVYLDASTSPMYGQRVITTEGANTLDTGYTGTSGEYNPALLDFSVGQHTVRVTPTFTIDSRCDAGSAVTCTENGSALEYVEFTFTVA